MIPIHRESEGGVLFLTWKPFCSREHVLRNIGRPTLHPDVLFHLAAVTVSASNDAESSMAALDLLFPDMLTVA
jgi:hypothetical protein